MTAASSSSSAVSSVGGGAFVVLAVFFSGDGVRSECRYARCSFVVAEVGVCEGRQRVRWELVFRAERHVGWSWCVVWSAGHPVAGLVVDSGNMPDVLSPLGYLVDVASAGLVVFRQTLGLHCLDDWFVVGVYCEVRSADDFGFELAGALEDAPQFPLERAPFLLGWREVLGEPRYGFPPVADPLFQHSADAVERSVRRQG